MKAQDLKKPEEFPAGKDSSGAPADESQRVSELTDQDLEGVSGGKWIIPKADDEESDH